GHTLALLVQTLIPPKSLVGIAERQWSPTLPLMVCIKSILFGRCPPRHASYV
ncbi:hypothetical protein L208DRAFT_1402839, partial [Tricholoma matsutake]